MVDRSYLRNRSSSRAPVRRFFEEFLFSVKCHKAKRTLVLFAVSSHKSTKKAITTKKSIRLFFIMKCYYSLAALALVPTMASGFGLTRFRRPMVVYSPVESLIQETEALMNRQFGQLQNDFGRFSPKYEITNTDDKFELAVDVPGVKAQDVNITLENDGQVLAISGERQDKGDNYAYSSKFYQSFSLDPCHHHG